MKIISIVGARPNFMKIAPFVRAIEAHNKSGALPLIDHKLIHTGQHYDENMSKSFFDVLDIPHPDMDLNVGSGTHAEQIEKTIAALDAPLKEEAPDWVVVVGDVNATCAAAIATQKYKIPLAHIESGLRSFDMTMPEETNRMVTDHFAHALFTPDEGADKNLVSEGIGEERIHRVGNIMIDVLNLHREEAARLNVEDIIDEHGLDNNILQREMPLKDYAVLTLHRPSNVDDAEVLYRLVKCFADDFPAAMPLIWILHPRTVRRLEEFDLMDHLLSKEHLIILHPVNYLEMLKLNLNAKLFLSDSGGLQEECCVLGTPCVTLRANTERPITLRENGGTCVLAGNDTDAIRAEIEVLLVKNTKPFIPPLWDGHTAERIVEILANA